MDNSTHYYGALTDEISARELAHTALARKAAREGIVLLKNDGALPLRPGKIALFGPGARKTTAGGTGSGDVSPRYKVNIEEGLIHAGYTITSGSWLDDYDREYAQTHEAFRQMVEEKIAGIRNPIEQITTAGGFTYHYPAGRLISEQDAAESGTDTAVYVLMRQAGEGNDRKNIPGDFLLTDTERQNLAFLAQHYAHLVLVINVGGLIDLSVLDEQPGIGAVVFMAQSGMEGGNALADLLSGRENFSGRLADTWPMRYEDIPGSADYSSSNGNLEQEFYTEGIYVGYRYFDSFGVTPRFPFGFGLSYTTFKTSVEGAALSGSVVNLLVNVTNTGSVSGREVVQAYLSVPGDVQKSLAAFRKTKDIAPGASEQVILSFDLSEQAVWSDPDASYVLPAGDYVLCTGTDSRNTAAAAVITCTEKIVVRQAKHCCVPTVPVEEIQPEHLLPLAVPEDVIRLTADPRAFHTEKISYTFPEMKTDPQAEALLAKLTPEEMIELLCGGDLQDSTSPQHQVTGASGKTAFTLWDRGIRNIVMSDGPAGANVMNEVIFGPDGTVRPAAVPERYNWGLMKQMAPRLIGHEGTRVYRYATAWPVEELLAQTWDPALLEEVGRAVGAELAEFGITLWLAPGMNIHRNPLCGRTFEYYSEDPLLSGTMAAALTCGVQSHPGIGVTIKHFCCNNQEDNRLAVSSEVSERALREIYLKGFEIAVRKSAPLALMTSYNKLNGTYTGNRFDLITEILRCEWGYRGLVMTDWGTRYDTVKSVQAGTDLTMPGSRAEKDVLTAALHDGTLDAAAVRRSAAEVLQVVVKGITE